MGAPRVLVVGSGKGGVGKSTVALNLALAFAEGGSSVGLADADVYGPNIPLMVGLTRSKWARYWTLAVNPQFKDQTPIPPVEKFGLRVASIGFFIGEDQPLVWTGDLVSVLIWQLIHQVDWGDLETLIVDLPPGSGDVQQTILKEASPTGAVVVVTPQYVAHLDARKAVSMYRQAGVAVLGGVENMSGYVCRHCGERDAIFPPVPHSKSIWAMDVPHLGAIPILAALGGGGESGPPFMVSERDSPAANTFREIARRLSAAEPAS